jgi:hypothetical protein
VRAFEALPAHDRKRALAVLELLAAQDEDPSGQDD